MTYWENRRKTNADEQKVGNTKQNTTFYYFLAK